MTSQTSLKTTSPEGSLMLLRMLVIGLLMTLLTSGLMMLVEHLKTLETLLVEYLEKVCDTIKSQFSDELCFYTQSLDISPTLRIAKINLMIL